MALSEAERKERRRAKDRSYNERNREKRHAYWRAYDAAHREQRLTSQLARQAADPEKYRAIGRAARAKNGTVYNARKRDKRRANPEPDRQRNAQWRGAHQSELKIYYAAYDRAHPDKAIAKVARRRARKNAAPVNDFTADQWAAMKEQYDHCCVYCGRQMSRLTQDHIIPLSKGGSHTLSNIVPACRSCNSKKGTGVPLIPVQPLLCL